MENQPITLSFTVVNTGAVKGASQFTSFEVHATGCKDLNGMVRANVREGQPLEDDQLPAGFWREEALTPAAAIEQALGNNDAGELRGMGYLPKDFKVCSCCALNRMMAAGRVPAGYTGKPPVEEVVLVQGTELTEALQQLAQDRTNEVIAELEAK